MLNHFLNLTTKEKLTIIAGSIVLTAFMFALPWIFAVGCVVVGHGPEICGM